MKRLIATVLLTAACGAVCAIGAPRDRKVTAEYTYHLPDNVSPDEARAIAEQRAKAQAIADEFGTIVTQSSSIVIDTHNDESTTDFTSIGGSELKGEWIEDTSAPVFEYVTDGEAIALKVTVRGIIREITGATVPFDVRILRNGTTSRDEADRFVSGDDMYLSFNSPTSGYVAVYLIDAESNAYCLLPYQSQTDGYFATKANRQYLFFHPDHADGVGRECVDEFVLDTSREWERNRIITIFSTNRFFKAADTQSDVAAPRNLPYKDFRKWLADVRKRDTSLSVSEKAITITCNK